MCRVALVPVIAAKPTMLAMSLAVLIIVRRLRCRPRPQQMQPSNADNQYEVVYDTSLMSFLPLRGKLGVP